MASLDMALFPVRQLLKILLIVIQAFFVGWFLYAAYEIRMYPIKDYGYIIHEFDPWFNYRATEYLNEHGLSKFFKWYDYESWYPLGRPIGTTIYPGMQMTAVAIFKAMNKVGEFKFTTPTLVYQLNSVLSWLKRGSYLWVPAIPESVNFVPYSVNDICCLLGPWGGATASLFTGLLTYEVYRSVNAAVVAMGIMAIIPAHLMRSVAGEFDNEAVAMTAICSTFWLWCRSVRTPGSWFFGIFAGFSYMFMVAAWGGYIFVLNMIGVHALMLVCLGRFNAGVYKAYTLFFIIGTAGAIQIPVVNLQPLRSLEQMGPLLVFLGFHVLAFCDAVRRRQKMATEEFVMFRIKAVAFLIAVLIGVAVLLWPTGYFGPLSARIRGLFVKHTKTGNPLVDSVAEHQPASDSIYASYLNLPLDFCSLGVLVCIPYRTNGFYFMLLYGFIAMHFSGKMSRLVLICAPICAIAAACWSGFVLDQCMEPFFLLLGKRGYSHTEAVNDASEEAPKSNGSNADAAQAKAKSKAVGKGKENKGADNKMKKDSGKASKKNTTGAHTQRNCELGEWEHEIRPGGAGLASRIMKAYLAENLPDDFEEFYSETRTWLDNDKMIVITRAVVSLFFMWYTFNFSSFRTKLGRFAEHCDEVAQQLANPQVVYKVPDRRGGEILVDDYLKGYQWIDQNTPTDSRVMAWWDYGYQITGIAKRTSIADGNTWNHEHIATLGRTLTSPEKKAWNVIRHLADYVLVWAGGQGDDLAKSPHLARIGNSVFPDHCGDDDPKCNKFSFYSDGSPTPMMARSLLYKLVMNGVTPGVKADKRLFKEVFTSQYGLLRVYEVQNVSQESKAWVADPANRLCDAPGSWYCVGQYPPPLEKLIEKRRNFAQIEDFNAKGGGKSAYTKMIERELHGRKGDL